MDDAAPRLGWYEHFVFTSSETAARSLDRRREFTEPLDQIPCDAFEIMIVVVHSGTAYSLRLKTRLKGRDRFHSRGNGAERVSHCGRMT